MSRIDWAPLASRLRDARSIVLATHINADGDGLGCEVALGCFLADSGIPFRTINNEPVPPRYRFLRGSERIEAYEAGRHSRLIREADLVVVLDNSSVERLELLSEDVAASRALTVCIDHHSLVNPFWKMNCVDTDACASGQLIYELIRHMGGTITPPIAEALYVSYVTDTGHFRFSKTTPDAHRVIAELMEAGAISPSRIYTEVYENTSRGLAALTGIALSGMRYEHGGRFAWTTLTHAQVAACRGEEEDTGDLINQGLAVDGVVAGALFREMPDGRIKVSLRSRGGIDVHAVAARFGGGGHRNASGILMDPPLEEAAGTIVRWMEPVVRPEPGSGKGRP